MCVYIYKEMPFNIGESVNYITDGFLRTPFINSAMRNPVYTALLVTTIIMVIILIIFRDAETDEPLIIMIARAGFWIFLLMSCAMALHNKVLCAEVDSAVKTSEMDEVFGGDDFTGGILEEAIMPVHINTNF